MIFITPFSPLAVRSFAGVMSRGYVRHFKLLCLGHTNFRHGHLFEPSIASVASALNGTRHALQTAVVKNQLSIGKATLLEIA